jgi:hypothetical protein
VTVGATRLYRFVHRSAHRLAVRIPAHRAGTVQVTVANRWGSVTRRVTFDAVGSAGQHRHRAGGAVHGEPHAA